MPHGPTFFPSKGVCIYCGAASVQLSDEHIVPFSLGGVTVIRQASCPACADITMRFEQRVGRGLWGDARISYDAPSRRKKKRPCVILMSDSENRGKTIEVPAREYPAGFVFYKMGPPGLLVGLTEDTDTSKLWTMVVVSDDQRRNTFIRVSKKKLMLQFRHVPHEFGQLLAKIAYCQILTQLHPSDFNPICLPYILGTKTNVSHVVGGGSENPSPTPGTGYSLVPWAFVIEENRLLLMVTVRLFSDLHSPEYQVVVGEVIGVENITSVLKKLDALLD